MKILSFSDIFLGGRIVEEYPYFESLFSKDLIDYIYSADLRIATFRISYNERKTPDRNLAPWPDKLLQAVPKEMIILLEHLKIDYVSLANNHLFDYGEEGVKQTLRGIKKT